MTSALSGDITAVAQSSGDAGAILEGNYYSSHQFQLCSGVAGLPEYARPQMRR
ncbi:MAG: hypothetical protein LBU70_02230 [Chitinispirillales bacterium]|nr:hypothetical protein [Chitinispirillales bacterium]